MKRLPLIVGLLCVLLPDSPVEALSLAMPPEYTIIGEPQAGWFFARKHNPKKVIEVRKASDLEIYWKVVVPNFDPLYSIIRISVEGNYIVHARGNFSVSSVEDVCVEVFGKDGRRDSYLVKEVMPSLVETGSKSDIVPRTKWIKKLRPINVIEFTVELADGRYASFRMDERKVTASKPKQNKTE